MSFPILRKKKIGQVVRDDGPQSHLKKTGTPTMGGILILFSILVSSLLWCNLSNGYVWIVLFTMFSFGMIISLPLLLHKISSQRGRHPGQAAF